MLPARCFLERIMHNNWTTKNPQILPRKYLAFHDRKNIIFLLSYFELKKTYHDSIKYPTHKWKFWFLLALSTTNHSFKVDNVPQDYYPQEIPMHSEISHIRKMFITNPQMKILIPVNLKYPKLPFALESVPPRTIPPENPAWIRKHVTTEKCVTFPYC